MFRRLLAAAAASLVPLACAATGDERVETTLGSDQFIAGGSISRSAPVAGDLVAAAGELELDAPVQGDAVAAGGNVRIGGSVGQNVYAAGGRVNLNGAVARNVRVAGGRIELAPSAAVNGNITMAGGSIRMRGSVKGYVQAMGGEVFIDGPVDGDLVVNAGRLELGPNAKIGGSVRYRGGDAIRQDPAATVAGSVERLGSPGPKPGAHVAASKLAQGWIWSAGLILLAALMAAAVPPASMRVTREMRAHPGLSLLFGFIALVCIPMAAVVLLLTVIGIPLAMLVVLAYLILLALGYVATAVTLGDMALGRMRPADVLRSSWRVLFAMGAMLVLTLLARIPFVGGIIVFVAMLAGIGAIAMAFRPHKPDVAAAAAAT